MLILTHTTAGHFDSGPSIGSSVNVASVIINDMDLSKVATRFSKLMAIPKGEAQTLQFTVAVSKTDVATQATVEESVHVALLYFAAKGGKEVRGHPPTHRHTHSLTTPLNQTERTQTKPVLNEVSEMSDNFLWIRDGRTLPYVRATLPVIPCARNGSTTSNHAVQVQCQRAGEESHLRRRLSP